MKAERVTIVVPDDFPSVFNGTEAHKRAMELGDVVVFKERGADQEEEIGRASCRERV